jgi:Rieske Fe-S protein
MLVVPQKMGSAVMIKSRRSFLKNAATGTVGVGAAALAAPAVHAQSAIR